MNEAIYDFSKWHANHSKFIRLIIGFIEMLLCGKYCITMMNADRLNPLDAYSDLEFISRYRVDRVVFMVLIERLETYLTRATSRSHSISATTQLAATLQFLATGSFQTVVASCHGISQPSLSRCIGNVSNALCSCASDFIRFPNEAGQRKIQQGFQEKYGFPKVLGCIDGSHIVAPSLTNLFTLTERVIIRLTCKLYAMINPALLMLL